MAQYHIKLLDKSSTGEGGTALPIDAGSPNDALNIAQEKIGSGSAELWEGDRRLARLRNQGSRDNPVWIVD